MDSSNVCRNNSNKNNLNPYSYQLVQSSTESSQLEFTSLAQAAANVYSEVAENPLGFLSSWESVDGDTANVWEHERIIGIVDAAGNEGTSGWKFWSS